MEFVTQELDLYGEITFINNDTIITYEQKLVNHKFIPIYEGIYKFVLNRQDQILNKKIISYSEFITDILSYINNQQWSLYVFEEDFNFYSESPFPIIIRNTIPHIMKYQFQRF